MREVVALNEGQRLEKAKDFVETSKNIFPALTTVKIKCKGKFRRI